MIIFDTSEHDFYKNDVLKKFHSKNTSEARAEGGHFYLLLNSRSDDRRSVEAFRSVNIDMIQSAS